MSRSKAKGSGFELEIVRAHQALGIASKKMPLSGALGGAYRGDVQIAGLVGECKRRARGYSSLYKALEQGGGMDILFVRDDRHETLVVMPWETWECFLKWSNIPAKFPHTEDTENAGF
tara:strand:+ start:1764 stop:2117 length:354 start_codon:yes stop_codon:yes gene_type:complete